MTQARHQRDLKLVQFGQGFGSVLEPVWSCLVCEPEPGFLSLHPSLLPPTAPLGERLVGEDFDLWVQFCFLFFAVLPSDVTVPAPSLGFSLPCHVNICCITEGGKEDNKKIIKKQVLVMFQVLQRFYMLFRKMLCHGVR